MHPNITEQNNVILHLGVGSFHRAHQAVYIQRLIDMGLTDWVIVGGQLRNDMPEIMDAINQQHFYTLETISAQGAHVYQSIKSIAHIIPFQNNLQGLIEQAAKSQTKIISFTVTEAGYYLNDQDQLDMGFSDLVDDIERMKSSQDGRTLTLYGGLYQILTARMKANAGPVTLLNCDNLRHNGRRFRQGLLSFIEKVGDATLIDWVNEHTTCPNAMVDRITPRPSSDVRQRVLQATGVDDAAALMGEDFIQWVIEDQFCAGRPLWESVGVEMVQDVTPYEEAKISILNASHCCIAWAGALLGDQFIHQATLRDNVRQLAFEYVTQDVFPCLEPSPLNLELYRDVVLERFGNEAICDTIARVAMDGFSKIPGYIAPTIHKRLARDQSFDAVAVLPALFLKFLQEWQAGRISMDYQDQAMNPKDLETILHAPDPVIAFCSNQTLWGEIAQHQPWRDQLIQAIHRANERIDQLAG